MGPHWIPFGLFCSIAGAVLGNAGKFNKPFQQSLVPVIKSLHMYVDLAEGEAALLEDHLKLYSDMETSSQTAFNDCKDDLATIKDSNDTVLKTWSLLLQFKELLDSMCTTQGEAYVKQVLEKLIPGDLKVKQISDMFTVSVLPKSLDGIVQAGKALSTHPIQQCHRVHVC